MVFRPAGRFGRLRPTLSVLVFTLAALSGCTRDVPTAAPAPGAMAVMRGFRAATGSNTPVTALVADANAAVAPTLQIRSDGLGAYQNSSSLTSIIQSIGAWELDSYDPRRSTRTVYLDFSQPIAGSGPGGGNPIAIPSGLYKVHAIAKCNLYGTSMLTLAPGATISCPLHFGDVYSGGVKYAVQMNPFQSAADTAYPETNYANITCVFPASGAGPCSQWTILPSGTFIGTDSTPYYRNVGALLKYGTGKGATVVKEGDFYF